MGIWFILFSGVHMMQSLEETNLLPEHPNLHHFEPLSGVSTFFMQVDVLKFSLFPAQAIAGDSLKSSLAAVKATRMPSAVNYQYCDLA